MEDGFVVVRLKIIEDQDIVDAVVRNLNSHIYLGKTQKSMF